jgi:hypothetical protein
LKLKGKTADEFATSLKRRRIRYAYIFSGPYQKDGHLPSFAFRAHVRDSILRIKKVNPELKVLSWIGGVESKTVLLESETWLAHSIQDTARLLKTMPFDRVHVDLEFAAFLGAAPKEYASNWVRFFKRLRGDLPSAFISTTVVSSASGNSPVET